VLAFTIATATLLELQEIPRPVRKFPSRLLLSLRAGESWPAIHSNVAGVNVTLATGTELPVNYRSPDLPSILVAVIVAVPSRPRLQPVDDVPGAFIGDQEKTTVRSQPADVLGFDCI